MKKNRKVFTTNKEELKKLENERALFRVACKRCGHTVTMVDVNKTICRHCGYYIFKDAKAEFQYRMLEAKYKNEREI